MDDCGRCIVKTIQEKLTGFQLIHYKFIDVIILQESGSVK